MVKKKPNNNDTLKAHTYSEMLKIIGYMVKMEMEALDLKELEKELEGGGDYWNNGCVQRLAKLTQCFKNIHCLSMADWQPEEASERKELNIDDMEIMTRYLINHGGSKTLEQHIEEAIQSQIRGGRLTRNATH